MNILIWLPDFIWHLMVFVGVIGLFASQLLSTIPFVSAYITKYTTPIKALSVIVLLIGVYMEGAISYQSYWDVKVKDAQINAAKQETKAAEATIEVITKYVDRVKIVKEKSDVIIREVPKYITKEIDANCAIPDSIRMLHSNASRNEISEGTGSTNDTSSSSSTRSGSK